MSASLCYTIIVCILNFVMLLLTILYFNIKLPTKHPYRTTKEDLLKNYDIIKYQKRKIKLLKIRLFFIKLLHRKKGNKR